MGTRKALLRALLHLGMSSRASKRKMEAEKPRELPLLGESDVDRNQRVNARAMDEMVTRLLKPYNEDAKPNPSKNDAGVRDVIVVPEGDAVAFDCIYTWQCLRRATAKQWANAIAMACETEARVHESMVPQIHRFFVDATNGVLMPNAAGDAVFLEWRDGTPWGAVVLKFNKRNGRVVCTLQKALRLPTPRTLQNKEWGIPKPADAQDWFADTMQRLFRALRKLDSPNMLIEVADARCMSKYGDKYRGIGFTGIGDHLQFELA